MNDTDHTVLRAKTLVPEHVLFQEVIGNSALLNLHTETYYGLDDVGTQMWKTLGTSDCVGAAARSLADIYDAPLAQIEHDLVHLVVDLKHRGLIELAD